MVTKSSETPANYIHFAAHKPHAITAHKYRDELMMLLNSPVENAGHLFKEFKSVADNAPALRPAFYSAIHSAFDHLRHGLDHPQRWDELMSVIAEASVTDPTIEKYVREYLLEKTIPVLVGPQSTDIELQIASDILEAAGRYPNLEDAVNPQYVRPVVLWHLKNAQHRFEVSAPNFSVLRQSAPFASIITAIEIKYGVHVDSEKLPHDNKKNLVFKFTKSHDGIEVFVVDLSKPSRANHPHEIELTEAVAKYPENVGTILQRSADLPQQPWVSEIATHAYCRLG